MAWKCKWFLTQHTWWRSKLRMYQGRGVCGGGGGAQITSEPLPVLHLIPISLFLWGKSYHLKHSFVVSFNTDNETLKAKAIVLSGWSMHWQTKLIKDFFFINNISFQAISIKRTTTTTTKIEHGINMQNKNIFLFMILLLFFLLFGFWVGSKSGPTREGCNTVACQYANAHSRTTENALILPKLGRHFLHSWFAHASM